jgi:type VI protein secretion system component Hcp
MAVDSFLKINGINGDCAITGHEGDIEIIKFSQNFTYGKQRLDMTVDLFTNMDWENVTSQKVMKLTCQILMN